MSDQETAVAPVEIKVENKRDKVFCSFTKMVPVGEIREHPKNPNYHDREQIEILANVIKATGWRTPIGVSKLSGFIIRGHGRFAAAKALGLTEVPVDYQTYDSEAQELADLLADNKIADLGQIDYQGVSAVLKEIPPEQQLFSGFRDFEIAPLLMADWIKPGLAEMPESIFSYKFSVNEVQNAALRTAIKIIQSKTAKTLTDGECLEMLANAYLGKVIKEEGKEVTAPAAPVKLSEDLPKPLKAKVVAPVAPVPTATVNTVGSPRTFKVAYVASTLWGDIDATVVRAEDDVRYYTDNPEVVSTARNALDKKLHVAATVDMKGKDFWLTSLIAIEEKVDVA